MRITLVHSGALGDTVLLFPLLRSLRLRFANEGNAEAVKISVVMRPAFGQMLVMRELADAWHSADEAPHTRWFGPVDDASAAPQREPAWADCDLMISAVAGANDAWAEHARRALAAHPAQCALPAELAGRLFFFDTRPPTDYPAHVTQWQRETLARQGLALPEAPLPPLAVNPDGRILIHPGSGGQAKCWPRESYLQLAADLVRNGIRPTLILGEAEADRWGREAIKQLQENFDTLFHVGFYELSEKMARARLYLGNDSGVSHLAGAVSVPTLVIFGPSNDAQWRPLGPGVRVLAAPERGNLASLEVSVVLAAMLGEMARQG